jgi:hypothetical protein
MPNQNNTQRNEPTHNPTTSKGKAEAKKPKIHKPNADNAEAKKLKIDKSNAHTQINIQSIEQ